MNAPDEHEAHRLKAFRNGEKPSSLHTTIRVVVFDESVWFDRVEGVLVCIHQHQSDWPSDELWKTILPEWLLNSFVEYSDEEIQEIIFDRNRWSTLGWLFGSWLDLMRVRDWSWWSAKKLNDQWEVTVAVQGLPSPLGTLELLCQAAGAKIVTQHWAS